MLTGGEIGLKANNGYHHHPDTVALLCAFHRHLLQNNLTEQVEVTVPAFFLSLIARLGQDQWGDYQVIWSLLFPAHCDHRFLQPKKLMFDLGEERIDLELAWKLLFDPVDYGIEEISKRKRKHCKLLETKDLNLLGPLIAARVQERRAQRQAAHERLRQLDHEIEPNLTPIATPAKISKTHVEPPIKALRTPKSKTSLSSFFTITTVNKASAGEYFQPFFLKPNCQMAPICHFHLNKDEDDGWDRVLQMPRQVSHKRERAKCLGLSTGPLRAIMKLIQFHDNYRPAYWGTLRKPLSVPCVRQPFRLAPELDYQQDSEEEWVAEDDDGELGDAESIDNSDEDGDDAEDDDDEDEEENEAEEEGDGGEKSSWLVPDAPKKQQRGKLIILQPTWTPFDPRFTMHTDLSVPLDPWEGVSAPQAINTVTIAQIPDQMLSSLATLLDGSGLGVDRLYMAWSQQFPDQTPSKRHFMLRVNQLASKEGGKKWSLRAEYQHLKQ